MMLDLRMWAQLDPVLGSEIGACFQKFGEMEELVPNHGRSLQHNLHSIMAAYVAYLAEINVNAAIRFVNGLEQLIYDRVWPGCLLRGRVLEQL